MIDRGAVVLAAKRFDKCTLRKVEAEILNSVSEHKYGNGYSIPTKFAVVSGKKTNLERIELWQ
jgi:hypothetical protein